MNRQSFFKNLAALVGGTALAPVAKELSFWATAPNRNNIQFIAGYIKVTRHMMKNIPQFLEYLEMSLPSVLLNDPENKSFIKQQINEKERHLSKNYDRCERL